MPTYDECQELIDNCDASWMDDYNGTGVAGRLFTSMVNGNSVFFPAAGLANGDDIFGIGEHGDYHVWRQAEDFLPWKLHFNADDLYIDKILFRHIGYSIRGVCER